MRVLQRAGRVADWIAVLGLLLCASAALADASPIEMLRSVARVPVWPYVRVVSTDDRSLAPERAAELAAGPAGITVDSPDRMLGRGVRPYWAFFSVRNPESVAQLRLLLLESTTQYDTRLYARKPPGGWERVNSISEEAQGRLGGGTITPVWMLEFAPHQTMDFLLRLEGPSVVRSPLFLDAPLEFAKRVRRVNVALGFALGCCLFIGLYILYLRRFLEDRSVGLFLAMLVGNLTGALWLSGVLGGFFPGVPEPLLSQVGFAGFAVLFGCGCLHTRVYLDTSAWAPRNHRVLGVVGWAWLFVAPWLPAALPVGSRIGLVWGGSLVALHMVILAGLAARRRAAQSGFIAVAWVSNLFVGAYFAISRAVDDPSAWSPSSLALVQATVMATLFGFAMSQRLVAQRLVLAEARREAILQKESALALMQERSRLFAATNHDLRQPLFAASVFAGRLYSARTHKEKRESMRRLEVSLAEIESQLLGIQEIAAVHENVVTPPTETVPLDALLGPIVEEYRGRAVAAHVGIHYVPSRVLVATHPPYFHRIVRNVIANAVRYNKPGGRVLIGCRRAGGPQLVIADTGRGMSEDEAAHAFDAFKRFDTDRIAPDGFGLGLFSVKTLARALGLEVSLRSRIGQGTVFRMSLQPRLPD